MPPRRDARAAESDGLENHCGASHRGFKSHSLRPPRSGPGQLVSGPNAYRPDVRRDDIRAAVRAAVAARVPADERETDARARILAEIERLPFPFDEHADPTHVTGSAIVVGARGTVLHRHRRMGIWLQPGGHV